MRVAVISDAHIDHGVHELDASEAWVAATTWIAEHEVDLAIIAGDMFHDGRTEGPALNWAADGFKRITRSGAHVLVVVGNHEWRGMRPGGSGSFLPVESFGKMHKVLVVRQPRLVSIPGTDLRVAALPWPEPGEGAEEQAAAAGRFADQLLSHQGPRIAVAHAAVQGALSKSRRGSEVDIWQFSKEPVVALEDIDIPEAFGFTALGHIHRRQRLSDTCGYVGSTEAITFSDEGNTKGFSVFEWDDHLRGWSEEFIPTGVRSFLTVDVKGDTDIADQLFELETGTLVRLSIDDTEAVNVAAAIRVVEENGGIVVKLLDETNGTAAPNGELWIPDIEDDNVAITLEDWLGRWFDYANQPKKSLPAVIDLANHLSGATKQ